MGTLPGLFGEHPSTFAESKPKLFGYESSGRPDNHKMPTPLGPESRIGVDALLALSGAGRSARAYAFLYAAFRKTEVSANPVRDALDCLMPFIATYTDSIIGKQVTADRVQVYLKGTFGFDIPLYAIEQLIPALQKLGMVEYHKPTRAYVAKKCDAQFDVALAEIETDFDEVTAELAAYGKFINYPDTPPSGSWADALIAFLRDRDERKGPALTKVKGSTIDSYKAQTAVVGAFIKNLFGSKPELFGKLLRIFMGVLVEDFIAAVAEVGPINNRFAVVALYDTAVLLRLLGTSGKLLRTATEELNRYLQDLGFSIKYFAGNESEIAGIFDAIIFVKDSGKELEGETAAAIAEGEVSVADIRMLQNTFPERLATMNVFPAEQLEQSALENARHQIDEKGFAAFLLEEANAQGRPYGVQNRQHDAGYLATILRLRKGARTRDLLASGFVFVTTNRFLARASRRYLIQQKVIHPQHCPPILSVGQIATIAWLMKDQKIVPEKAGRELLCNCFAAVRPDAEWFRYFRDGIEKAIAGSVEEFSDGNGNALTLQAARRIAQEESFGSSALVRELNMAEILSRATQEEERRLTEHEAKAAELLGLKERQAAELADAAEARRLRELEEAEYLRRAEVNSVEQRHNAELEATKAEHADNLRRAIQTAADERESALRASMHYRADKRANAVLILIKIIFTIAFAVALGATIALQLKSEASVPLWTLSVVLGIISVFSFMDFLKLQLVEPVFSVIRAAIVKILDPE